MKVIWLLIIFGFFSTGMPVFADTGNYIYPTKSCASKIIECTSWYREPHACDQYLHNTQYAIVGGSSGASVQHYQFCKTSDARETIVSFFTSPQAFIIILFAIGLCAFIVLMRMRKKNEHR